jgi:hypothetical protein
LEALYLSETGYQLTFSNLASSHDLVGLKSLKAIIRGPFPDRWPLLPLLKLPVHELIIHYTGRYDAPTLLEVRAYFDEVYDPFRYHDGDLSTQPRLITLSWNCQEEKRDITLIERTFETSRLDPKNAKRCCAARIAKQCLMELPIGVNAIWPSLKVGLSKNMEVGYCTLKRSSDLYSAQEAGSVLLSAFSAALDLDSAFSISRSGGGQGV